jgi:hypothetical protein
MRTRFDENCLLVKDDVPCLDMPEGHKQTADSTEASRLSGCGSQRITRRCLRARPLTLGRIFKKHAVLRRPQSSVVSADCPLRYLLTRISTPPLLALKSIPRLSDSRQSKLMTRAVSQSMEQRVGVRAHLPVSSVLLSVGAAQQNVIRMSHTSENRRSTAPTRDAVP